MLEMMRLGLYAVGGALDPVGFRWMGFLALIPCSDASDQADGSSSAGIGVASGRFDEVEKNGAQGAPISR